MDNKLPSFMRLENEKLIFNGKNKELVAYIPEKFFERKLAEPEGEFIKTIGIFPYTVQDLNTGKNIGLKNFIYPTVITTMPGDMEKQKGIILTKNSDPEDFRIFRYRDGDVFLNSTKTVKFVGNVEKILNMIFILGYVPNTIPYDKISDTLIESMNIFGGDFGVNYQIIGLAISEVCRAKDNINIPYRLSGSTDLHEYKSTSLKNVSKLISPYTAIISEDPDESILFAMMNENPKETPLEKILVGEDNT